MPETPLIPLSKQFQSRAKFILHGQGLPLLKAKFFNFDREKAAKENFSYERADPGVTGGNGGYDIRAGMFGLPIWDIVTLVANPYTTDDGTVITTKSQLQFDIALCEISNPRNIVETSVAGRKHPIYEYMSDGAWQVNIKGCLVNELSNMPPDHLLDELNIMCSHPESVQVYSNFLDYFDIRYLVIKEPIIKQREGTRNVVDFELRCASDLPFDIDA